MVTDAFQSILGSVQAHPYLFLFVGMFFAGETILLPAIFLAITGRLSLAQVILIATAATLLSDLVWYASGRWFPRSALQRLPGRGTSRLVDGLDRLFARQGARVVFLSKFVYGTRTAAQILAGVHDMPFRVYFAANILGVGALTLILSGLAWSTAGAARRFVTDPHRVELAFVAFILIAATGYLVAAGIARREWSR